VEEFAVHSGIAGCSKRELFERWTLSDVQLWRAQCRDTWRVLLCEHYERHSWMERLSSDSK